MRPKIDLAIEAGAWPGEDEAQTWFEEAVSATASAVPFNLKLAEISVVLTNDGAMQALNREHRGIDKPTNVLSFPAIQLEQLDQLAGKRPVLLGDLVFALETVKREADAGQISLRHHMSHLIVHGFLHLLGYDHDDETEADAMEALETRVLATLGVADPYGV